MSGSGPEHHSNMPKRGGEVDPHKLTSRGNIQQASAAVNRFARRDPALYPLSFVIVGIAAVTGYFAMKKAFEPDAERRFADRIHPWEKESEHETAPGSVAEFKYRYKARDGSMEDAHPTINSESRKLKDDVPHKYHT